MTKRISILGSTGSIGVNTVHVVSAQAERYEVEALTAYNNVPLLAQQARQLNAKIAVVADTRYYHELQTALAGSGIEAAAGEKAVIEAAGRPVDWVMAAIVGAAGLAPVLAAIHNGATIALANKECLVCAGELVLAAVKRHEARLIPVDSEHNAIFQVFDFEQPEQVEKIILTASGGPFRTFSAEQMRRVTLEQALAHPNWNMGRKISVDSATMMNKGLELIEAYYLFPVRLDQIEVLVHPESIVHSMVQYRDGSLLAQMGMPDMCTPIAVALGWPERLQLDRPRLNLAALGRLHFEAPNEQYFPALRLAREAIQRGGAAPAVLNAANEIAVKYFIAGEIGFLDIPRIVENVLSRTETMQFSVSSLEEVLHADAWAREQAKHYARERALLMA